MERVGVLARGVVERGVPGMLLAGEFTRLDVWLEDAPLMYPLVLAVLTERMEARPELSDLLGAGRRI